MKRGKRFLENDNMFIYVGTAIFILLAISIGIIMYMTTRTGVEIENSEQSAQNDNIKEITESVTSEIGKKVKEQENNTLTDTSNEETTKTPENTTFSNETVQINTEPEQQEIEPQIQQEATQIKNEISFIKPTEGEVICEYAKDNLIYSETLKEWITHTGIDIKADKTSVIKSAADGVVKSIVNDPRYGLTVIIEHEEGYQTIYSNLLTAEFVVEGEEIAQGQTIGTVGNTASFESNMECHLHFELIKDGEYLDPTIYLN